MKAADDKKTPDLLGDKYDLAGERPAPVNKAAIRAARFREKHGVSAMTVNIDNATLLQFNLWLAKQGKKRSAVIQSLIEKQVLRKR